MLRWIVGRDKLNSDEKTEIRKKWADLLVPAQKEDEQKKMWTQVEKLADTVRGK
jgi:hypothetical protein